MIDRTGFSDVASDISGMHIYRISRRDHIRLIGPPLVLSAMLILLPLTAALVFDLIDGIEVLSYTQLAVAAFVMIPAAAMHQQYAGHDRGVEVGIGDGIVIVVVKNGQLVFESEFAGLHVEKHISSIAGQSRLMIERYFFYRLIRSENGDTILFTSLNGGEIPGLERIASIHRTPLPLLGE